MAYKNQHHVEASYLRGFSKDGTRFDIYLIKQGCVLREKSVKDQCREDWYYEKGGDFERRLNKIEQIGAGFRKDVTAGDITLAKGNDAHKCLAMGAVIQRIRGPEYLDWAADIAKRTNQKPLNRSDLLGALIGCARSIYDLDLRILRAEGAGLITSDNPVAAQNRIVKRHNQVGNTGVGMVGLELVWPLDPRTALYFFDGASYQCVGHFGETIEINEEETDEINGLQVQNALRCLYAQGWMERMSRTVARYRRERPLVTEEDGSSTHGISKQDRITTPWYWKKSPCRTEVKAWSDIMCGKRNQLFQTLDSGRYPLQEEEIMNEIDLLVSQFKRSAFRSASGNLLSQSS